MGARAFVCVCVFVCLRIRVSRCAMCLGVSICGSRFERHLWVHVQSVCMRVCVCVRMRACVLCVHAFGCPFSIEPSPVVSPPAPKQSCNAIVLPRGGPGGPAAAAAPVSGPCRVVKPPGWEARLRTTARQRGESRDGRRLQRDPEVREALFRFLWVVMMGLTSLGTGTP